MSLFTKTILAIVVCSGSVFAKTVPDRKFIKEQIQEWIDDAMDDADAVGAHFLMVEGDHIALDLSFGKTHEKKGKTIQKTTVFRTGSLTKLMHALYWLKLQESGQYNLDDTLVSYLPEFQMKYRKGSHKDITFRQLLTHRAGLPLGYYDGMWAEKPEPYKDLLDIFKDRYGIARPGKVLSFSHLGFVFSALALEKATQKEFSKLLWDHIFKPLGMTKSSIAGNLQHRVNGAYEDGDEVKNYGFRDLPSVGLNTSPDNMAKFIRMLNGNGVLDGKRFLSTSSVNEMFRIQNADNPLDVQKVGLGWYQEQQFGLFKEKVFGQRGRALAHQAFIRYIPELKTGLVFMCNSKMSMWKLSNKITNLILHYKKGKAWDEDDKFEKKWAKSSTVYDFSGTFATMAGFVNIKKSGEGFDIDAMGKSFRLFRNDEGHYNIRYNLFGFVPLGFGDFAKIRFTRQDIDETTYLFGEYPNGQPFLAGIRFNKTPHHVAWNKRLGKYKLLNPPPVDIFKIESIELLLESQQLMIAIETDEGTFSFPVNGTNDKEFFLFGVGNSLGDTVYLRKHEGKQVLEYSGFLFEKVGS